MAGRHEVAVGGVANRVVEAPTRLYIEVVELLILIIQLSRAENGPGAFAVSSRPALRNKLTATPSPATTTGTNITTTTPPSPPRLPRSHSPLSVTTTIGNLHRCRCRRRRHHHHRHHPSAALRGY